MNSFSVGFCIMDAGLLTICSNFTFFILKLNISWFAKSNSL